MCFSVKVLSSQARLQQEFGASVDFEIFNRQKILEDKLGRDRLRKVLGLKKSPSKSFFREVGDDDRLYPNLFANVLISLEGKRVIKKMRYRVRPFGSTQEIPSRYNVFNARIDSLEKRKTWSSVFGRHHAVVAFESFYEWVEGEHGRSQLICFSPSTEFMWAPCLYHTWQDKETGVVFSSFAIITDDPPEEVEAMGHDRCPIFIAREQIDNWLNPSGQSKRDLFTVLNSRENVFFSHEMQSRPPS